MADPRFSIIPADAVLDKRIEPRDLQVLCVFGKHTDKRGWCRRSQVVMAREIGCARSTVQASIDRLVEAGWLEKRPVTEIHTKGVRGSAHEYRVVLDVPDPTQDVVFTPADRSAPPAAHTSAPPADPRIGTYVNDPLSTIPSLTRGERASFDEVWDAFPKRPMTNRKEAQKAFSKLTDDETQRLLIAAKRFAQWHIEDSESRGVKPEDQLEFRPGLGKWIRTSAWIGALHISLKADPVPPLANGLVVLKPDHPDFQAVEKMRGRPVIVGKSGTSTFRIEEIEQARASA
ncbi:helix-turn-helix domain-containing protein [Devosia submarina]|uniref:helix-turn-helix domain-containing protein n=1 Tax=Devosia submarina TaxID=1173082 RepID=UPI000D398753|nr:helix-turn-helix domain-containing protein [Devosia submarina]